MRSPEARLSPREQFKMPDSRTQTARAAVYVSLLSAAVPLLLLAWFIVSRSNAAPVGDEWWDSVHVAVKTRAGLLGLDDVLMYYEGHRSAIVRLIAAAGTVLGDFDLQVLRFTTYLFTLLSLAVASLLFVDADRTQTPVAAFFFASVLATLYFPDSWLDYQYSTWQQTLCFTLLGLLAIQRLRPGWLTFSGVLLCAVCAGLSLGLGVAAWIALPFAALGSASWRRKRYLFVWTLAFTFFLILYTSAYAVPFNQDTPRAYPAGRLLMAVTDVRRVAYPFVFQSARFDTSDTSMLGVAFTAACWCAIIANIWWITRTSKGLRHAAPWIALAVFSFVGALLPVIRGATLPVVGRYSPGGDGFWLAVVASALLVVAQHRRRAVRALNVSLLIVLLVLTVRKDVWSLQQEDSYPPACDICARDYPLNRDDCFSRLRCFYWADEQSIYLLAALRLSIFGDQVAESVLPSSDAPVITDLSSRWLTVYVRDFMLGGLPTENLYPLAPEIGNWRKPNEPSSPWHSDEWPLSILPVPLQRVWSMPADLMQEPSLFEGRQTVWYLNTPETQHNFPFIETAMKSHNFTGHRVPISNVRFRDAQFGLWRFERQTPQ